MRYRSILLLHFDSFGLETCLKFRKKKQFVHIDSESTPKIATPGYFCFNFFGGSLLTPKGLCIFLGHTHNLTVLGRYALCQASSDTNRKPSLPHSVPDTFSLLFLDGFCFYFGTRKRKASKLAADGFVGHQRNLTALNSAVIYIAVPFVCTRQNSLMCVCIVPHMQEY